MSLEGEAAIYIVAAFVFVWVAMGVSDWAVKFIEYIWWLWRKWKSNKNSH